jgi:hypothetical protein
MRTGHELRNLHDSTSGDDPDTQSLGQSVLETLDIAQLQVIDE